MKRRVFPCLTGGLAAGNKPEKLNQHLSLRKHLRHVAQTGQTGAKTTQKATPYMLNRRNILAGAGATLLAANAPQSALSSPTTLLSPQAIKSDVALLQEIYETLHPGLYRYNSPAQIKAAFRVLSAQFEAPAPLSHVYLAFSRVLASVRCGHSYANFYSQSDAVKEALFAGKNRLPFLFAWFNQMMVVTDGAGVEGLSRGARITHINGIATRTILSTLLPYVRADGHNIGKQTSLLSVNRDEGYQSFDIFYALHYGSSARFELRGIKPDGGQLSMTVEAINLETRKAMTATPAVTADVPAWSVQLRADKIAILTMPTFGLYRTNWDWKAWLASTFAQVNGQNSKAIIMDIRGNEGGRDDCGPEILGYLTKSPLPAQAGGRRLAYRAIPAKLNAVLDTWDDRFRDWGDNARPRSDGMYDLLDEAGRSGGGVTPKATYFGGKVIVLSDAANSSATLQFCQMLRANGLGRIVGSITGGNLRGINAEKFMFARLPGTGLEVDVPLVGYYPNDNPRDGGLIPDQIVSPTWRDIALGRDRVLDRAITALS
jgi:Peptidase family S41